MENTHEVSIDESLQIPVVDMGKLATDHVGHQNEKAKLHQACKEWGFFQLINHGAATAVEKMKAVVEDFFKLPLEQKMAIAHEPNSNYQGYAHVSAAPSNKLEWGEMLFLSSLPVSQRNVKFWPSTPTTFRSTLDEYSVELHKLSMSLIKLMASNLGVNPEIFNSMYEDGTQAMRFNYYPPADDKVINLVSHTDPTGLTLLVQVNEVNGLEINKDGKWTLVKPTPGAIIVNLGDIMEVMTNGEYKSIVHRAVVNFQKERLSVAAPHSPNMRTKIGPLPDLIKGNAANYKTLEREEYIRLLYSGRFAEQNLLSLMKINNSQKFTII